MSTTKIILTVTFIIAVSICFWQCGKVPQSSMQTIILDNTEETYVHITFEELKGISALKDNLSNGEVIRLLPITEFNYPVVVQHQLEPVGSQLLGNEVRRGQEVKTYWEEIEADLHEISGGKKARNSSVIFPVIFRELEQLSQSDALTKRLIVYSDLMEKSEVADFYSGSQFKQIAEHPDKFIQEIEAKHPLPDLTGIEVYLVYQPANDLDNIRFEITSRLYKTLLETKGAKVHISANLIIAT